MVSPPLGQRKMEEEEARLAQRCRETEVLATELLEQRAKLEAERELVRGWKRLLSPEAPRGWKRLLSPEAPRGGERLLSAEAPRGGEPYMHTCTVLWSGHVYCRMQTLTCSVRRVVQCRRAESNSPHPS